MKKIIGFLFSLCLILGFSSASYLFFEDNNSSYATHRQAVPLHLTYEVGTIDVVSDPLFGTFTNVPLSINSPSSGYYNSSANLWGHTPPTYGFTWTVDQPFFMFDPVRRSFGFGWWFASSLYDSGSDQVFSVRQDFVAGPAYDSSSNQLLTYGANLGANEYARIFSVFGTTGFHAGLDFMNYPVSLDSWVMYKANYITYNRGVDTATPFIDPNGYFRAMYFGRGNASSAILTTQPISDFNISFASMYSMGLRDHTYGTTRQTSDEYRNSLFIALDGGYNATYSSSNWTLVLTPGDGLEALQYVKATVYGCRITHPDFLSGTAHDSLCPVLINGYLSYTNDSSGSKIFPRTDSSTEFDLSDSKYGFWFPPENEFVDVTLASNVITWSDSAETDDFYIVSLDSSLLTGVLSNTTTAIDDLYSNFEVSAYTGIVNQYGVAAPMGIASGVVVCYSGAYNSGTYIGGSYNSGTYITGYRTGGYYEAPITGYQSLISNNYDFNNQATSTVDYGMSLRFNYPGTITGIVATTYVNRYYIYNSAKSLIVSGAYAGVQAVNVSVASGDIFYIMFGSGGGSYTNRYAHPASRFISNHVEWLSGVYGPSILPDPDYNYTLSQIYFTIQSGVTSGAYNSGTYITGYRTGGYYNGGSWTGGYYEADYCITGTASSSFVSWSCYGSGDLWAGFSLNLADFVPLLSNTFLDVNLLAPLICIPTSFYNGVNSSSITSLTSGAMNYSMSGTSFLGVASQGDKDSVSWLFSLLFSALPIYLFIKLIL